MSNRFAIFLVVLCSFAFGQNQAQNQPSSGAAQSSAQQSMPGMDMSHHDMSNMPASSNRKDMPDKDTESDAGAHVMHAMEGHMDMGPHMKMTALRQPKPGDAVRAQQVADEAKKVAGKYADY